MQLMRGETIRHFFRRNYSFSLNKDDWFTTVSVFCLVLMLEVPFAGSCLSFDLGNEALFWEMRE